MIDMMEECAHDMYSMSQTTQPLATWEPRVGGDGIPNCSVALLDAELAQLPQGSIHAQPNELETVCALSLMCNHIRLLSLPEDLLLNIAIHLQLDPMALVAFLSCCHALWAPGRNILFKARVQHQLVGRHGLDTGAYTCPTPCRSMGPNFETADEVLCHMARGVAIAIGALMNQQTHGQSLSIFNEQRCVLGSPYCVMEGA